MSKSIILSFLTLFLGFACQANETDDVKAIKASILGFSKAGDENNVVELEKYMDANFRVVMNRLFGSAEVAVLDKQLYTSKIQSKEFGGDQRQVTIDNVVVNGSSASAKVTFAGSKMTFVSIITLVKNESGTWKLLSDIPNVI